MCVYVYKSKKSSNFMNYSRNYIKGTVIVFGPLNYGILSGLCC
jgi:hypothetical protein